MYSRTVLPHVARQDPSLTEPRVAPFIKPLDRLEIAQKTIGVRRRKNVLPTIDSRIPISASPRSSVKSLGLQQYRYLLFVETTMQDYALEVLHQRRDGDQARDCGS